MADNKIEDALEKAGEILDENLTGSEKVQPTIEINGPSEMIAEDSISDIVAKIVSNDYASTPVKIKGTVKNISEIHHNGKQLEVDSNGIFWLEPTEFSDTELTFKVVTGIGSGNKELSLKLEVVREEDSIVLCHSEYKETIVAKYGSVKVIAGKNCDGATVTICNSDICNNVKFDEVNYYPLNSELEISVENNHYITKKQLVTVTENHEIIVDLEPRDYQLLIKNSIIADTIDIHVGADSIHYIEPLTLKYGTKIVITATKKGYKDYQYTIDSLNEDTVIDINKMERVQYSLTVNAPENSVITVNGTINSIWPLKFEEGTEINLSVSKNHYETYTNTFKITEDKVFDVTLELVKHTLTVTTEPNNSLVTLTYDGTEYQKRQIEVPYGASVKVKVESIGYNTIERTLVISEDTTENIVLEKQSLLLTVASKKEGILNGATIIVNNVKQQTNKAAVKYGELNNVSVMKPGYPTFTTTVTCTEDTTIYVDAENEWRKPQVTINISNKQDIVNPVVITINGNVVSENSPVDIDYNSTANIVVTCDGYKSIAESKQITTDYNPYYELIDVNSDKVKLDVNCLLEGANVTIDGKSATSMYIVPNNTVTVKITHVGYETIIDKFVITENTVKEYSMDMFKPKNFKLTVVTNPIMADVTLTTLDTSVTSKTITVPYLTNVTVKAFIPGYISKEEIVEVTKEMTYTITLEEDPNYNGDLSMGEITLEKIIEMIKFRKSYSYLNISQVFRTGGYTNETVYAFYVRFGSYCTSRYDFNLWRMMHTYFGHIENIPHPDTKG